MKKRIRLMKSRFLIKGLRVTRRDGTETEIRRSMPVRKDESIPSSEYRRERVTPSRLDSDLGWRVKVLYISLQVAT